MRPKIHIIGSVGSGKSTLARKLSATLELPYYELDNIVWRRVPEGPDIRNPDEERDRLFHGILATDGWIVEGAHRNWVQPSWERADLIVYLDTPIRKRNYRILKRFLVQKLGFEKGNYKQSFDMLAKMYRWSYNHARTEKPKLMEQLKPYGDKLVILTDNTELDRVVRHVRGDKR
ncbi:DNA topology modulation protein FlaR [Paenibacillus sp. CC-CFT747]|nr:DNA topology modulation protein FlaR [Paenibacillus sp. CC-CFT747]